MSTRNRTNKLVNYDLPIGGQLYRLLRQQIIRNEILPGSRISESQIADFFSVSRQPVREAFIKLSEEGLLVVRPQRGTYVRKILTTSVMDARFVREAIEADIVKLLATNATSKLLEDLKQQLQAQRVAAADNDSVNFIELDELFHRTLAEGANRVYAWKIIEGLKAQFDRVRYLSVFQFSMEKIVEQHSAIVDGIIAADKQLAEQAMRSHLQEILNDLPAIAKANPTLFEETED